MNSLLYATEPVPPEKPLNDYVVNDSKFLRGERKPEYI